MKTAPCSRRLGVVIICVLVCCVAVLLSMAPRSSARADVMRQRLSHFPLRANITVLYETHQQNAEQGQFTSRVRFSSVGESSARYHWMMYNERAQGHASRGVSLVRDLNSCEAFDPWWPVRGETNEEFLPERCELWLSRTAYRDIKLKGHAFFKPDQETRNDREMKLILKENTHLTVMIDGHPTPLPVLEITSEENDQIWVHDSEQNPYVLKSRIKGGYSWRVTDIYIHKPPPSPPLFPF